MTSLLQNTTGGPVSCLPGTLSIPVPLARVAAHPGSENSCSGSCPGPRGCSAASLDALPPGGLTDCAWCEHSQLGVAVLALTQLPDSPASSPRGDWGPGPPLLLGSPGSHLELRGGRWLSSWSGEGSRSCEDSCSVGLIPLVAVKPHVATWPPAETVPVHL